MVYKAKEKTAAGNARSERPAELPDAGKIASALEPVVQGLGFAILEFSVSRHDGRVQIRMVIARLPGAFGQKTPSIGTAEVGRVHRSILPRLELALEGADFSVNCLSPGIDRTIKEGAEFAYFLGSTVRCYLPEVSDWVRGVLKASDENKIILENGDGEMELKYENIAKAKLDG
ncbi:MAG: ribosome assembly cofactor RimP [Treponema sp.]|jgi:ribosome maturation factor RimP|nr:ribosome assembly cofactor RimP [Treponema sp.]